MFFSASSFFYDVRHQRLLWVFVGLGLLTNGGATEGLAPLTTAIEVRSLSVADAEKSLPIHLHGTVTFAEPDNAIFIQDATAGTFFRPQPGQRFQQGDVVEIWGITQPGLFLPGTYLDEARPEAAKVIGREPLPAALPVRYSDLFTGRYHYQRVEIEGVVRSIEKLTEERPEIVLPTRRSLMRVAMEGGVVEVKVEQSPDGRTVQVDDRIKVKGLLAGSINSRRQLVTPYIRLMTWIEASVVESALPEDAVPLVSARDIMTFHVAGHGDRRVRMAGIVTACLSNGLCYARGAQGGFGIAFTLPTEVRNGDRIEVIGFPEMDAFSARLADAKLVSQYPGAPVEPVQLTVVELLAGKNHGDLVAVVARISDSYRTDGGAVLTLQDGGVAIQVRGPMDPEQTVVGSLVEVVGVCAVESTVGEGYNARPEAVTVRMRSVADLTLLKRPSGWTVQRLVALLCVALAVVLLAGLWITMLRRQVVGKTKALAAKISSEAALAERHRIAREFHDTLEQELVGLSLRLDAAASLDITEKGRNLLVGSRNLVTRIQDETRSLISDLRNSAESAGDLGLALRDLVAHHQPNIQIPLELRIGDGVPLLSPREVHHLRMIAGEGVTNALKHARADQIEIWLGVSGEGLRLTVVDDGCGFDPITGTGLRGGHFGCVGIRERCSALGATVQWISPLEGGTHMIVVLPLSTPSI